MTLGIRVVGMRFRRNGKWVSHDKDYGKALTDATIGQALQGFFDSGKKVSVGLITGQLRKDVAAQFVTDLVPLQQLFKVQRCCLSSIRMTSTVEYQRLSQGTQCRFRMIDFAHVHPITDNGLDEGYLIGLENLIGLLKVLK